MSLQNRTPSGKEDTTQFSAAAATTAKTPIVINGRLFIPINTADAAALNSFWTRAQISDYTQAAVVFAPGDAIYWDDVAKAFTNLVAAGVNIPCGYAIEASASASGAGLIQFDAFAPVTGALVAWATALATKLNADAGVTDTNYDTNPLA